MDEETYQLLDALSRHTFILLTNIQSQLHSVNPRAAQAFGPQITEFRETWGAWQRKHGTPTYVDGTPLDYEQSG